MIIPALLRVYSSALNGCSRSLYQDADNREPLVSAYAYKTPRTPYIVPFSYHLHLGNDGMRVSNSGDAEIKTIYVPHPVKLGAPKVRL